MVISFLFFSGQTLIAGRTSPVFLGIANAVLLVAPLMLIAATPVEVLLVKLFHWSMPMGFYYSVVDCFINITFPRIHKQINKLVQHFVTAGF